MSNRYGNMNVTEELTRISSHATFFYKRVFPISWFGFLALFAIVGVTGALLQQRPVAEVLVFGCFPIFMMAFGAVLFSFTLLDLVDEVWDAGDALIIRNRGQEERIPLADICRVKGSLLINPERITIYLERNTSFGPRIAFLPTMRWIRLTVHPAAIDLMDRVDAVRQGTARP